MCYARSETARPQEPKILGDNEFELDGAKYSWRLAGFFDGIVVSGIGSLLFDLNVQEGKDTGDAILAVRMFKAGSRHGESIGRSQKANEIRRALDL